METTESKSEIRTMLKAHQSTKYLNRECSLFILFSLAVTIISLAPVWLIPSYHLATAPTGDKGTNLWNLWWVYFAIFERGQSPLWCDWLFYPWGVDLRNHTLSLTNGLLAAPVTGLFGPVVAYKFLYVVSTFLTMVFAGLWARRFALGWIGAALVGVLGALGPFRVAHQIHLNLFNTHWLFITFWLIERAIQYKRFSDWCWVSLAWVLTTFGSFYFCLFVGLYLLVRLLVAMVMNPPERIRLILQLMLPFCSVLGILLVFFYGMDMPRDVEADQVPMVQAMHWSMSGEQLLLPGWVLERIGWGENLSAEHAVHPGMLMVLLAALGLLVIKRWKTTREIKLFTVTAMLVFFVMSLGPVLKWGGGAIQAGGIPVFLPAALLEFFPKLDSMRVFSRFAYVGFLLLSLWAGFTLDVLVNSKNLAVLWLSRVGVGAYLVYWTVYAWPVMVDYETPAPVAEMVETGFESGTRPVLELPFEPTRLSGMHLYHQTMHKQPLYVAEFSRLSGYRRRYLNAFPALEEMNAVVLTESVPKFEEKGYCNQLEGINTTEIWISGSIREINELDNMAMCGDIKLKSYGLDDGLYPVK